MTTPTRKVRKQITHGWAHGRSRFGHGWSRLVTGRVPLIIYWAFIFGHARSRPVTVQHGHISDEKISQHAKLFSDMTYSSFVL